MRVGLRPVECLYHIVQRRKEVITLYNVILYQMPAGVWMKMVEKYQEQESGWIPKLTAQVGPCTKSISRQKIYLDEIIFQPKTFRSIKDWCIIDCKSKNEKLLVVNLKNSFWVYGIILVLAPSPCPDIDCDLPCEHGFVIDETGCRICACRDPCSTVKCSNPREACHLQEMACSDPPCPALPVCLVKEENPCDYGEPLKDQVCGPQHSTCPSSHQCRINPFTKQGKCCTKSRKLSKLAP